MAVVNPIDNPQAHDFILLGTAQSPGICRPFEPKREADFDVKKGKGTFGSTVTYVGRPPAKWGIVFELWLARHWDEWTAYVPLLNYDPTKKKVQAIDIYHPSLAEIGIKSVVTTSIGMIKHEGKGLYTRTVEFLEYFPSPKVSAVSTPSGSQATSPNAAGGRGRGGRPTTDELQAAAERREIAERERIAADLLRQATAP